MANIMKNGSYMALPINIKRGNPIPVDDSLIWYSLSELQDYAQNSPVAYVGQVLTLVNEEEGRSIVYVIKNATGELEQISSQSVDGAYLPLAGGTLTGALTLADGGKAMSEYDVATAIAEAGHLSRAIVEELPAAEDAVEGRIYMLKQEGVEGDAYKEYMLIEGELVQVGDSSVDLSGYAKVASDSYPLTEGALVSANADGALVSTEKSIEDFVEKEEGKELVPSALLEKLQENAAIKGVSDDLIIDEDGILAVATRTENGKERKVFNGTKIFSLSNNYEWGYHLSPINVDKSVTGNTLVKDIIEAHEEGWDVIVKDGDYQFAVVEYLNTEDDSYKAVALHASSIDPAALLSGNATVMMQQCLLVYVPANDTTFVINDAGALMNENTINEYITNNFVTKTEAADFVTNDSLAEYLNTNNYITEADMPAIATLTVEGLVKSSEDDNKVKVADDGTMELNRVSAMKLYVPDGDELVLDGGAAN